VNLYSDGVTISDVARRTGVGISTLRAWERRYGFPVAQRLPGGHRRYTEGDVDTIKEIERERRAGATLAAAVGRARERNGVQRSSLFATLRQALPHTSPSVLSKRTMLAISRAIEDEASARADAPLLIGAFQDTRSWKESAARWTELAAGSRTTAVLADFRRPRHRTPLFEISLPAGSPMLREWAMVCDSPTFSACVVGVEQLHRQRSDGPKRFEALWTVEPLAVREVARTGCAIAANVDPEAGAALHQYIDQPARATYDTIRIATSVTNRIIAALDRA